MLQISKGVNWQESISDATEQKGSQTLTAHSGPLVLGLGNHHLLPPALASLDTNLAPCLDHRHRPCLISAKKVTKTLNWR